MVRQIAFRAMARQPATSIVMLAPRLESHNTSPLTGLPLSTHELTPNTQLLSQIAAATSQ